MKQYFFSLTSLLSTKNIPNATVQVRPTHLMFESSRRDGTEYSVDKRGKGTLKIGGKETRQVGGRANI